jgi:kynureninase
MAVPWACCPRPPPRLFWITQPQRIGDKIARQIGAAPGEVADSISINRFKELSAIQLALVGMATAME